MGNAMVTRAANHRQDFFILENSLFAPAPGSCSGSVVATKAATCLRQASCALVRHRLPGNVLKDLRLTFRQTASCARQAPPKRAGVLPAASHRSEERRVGTEWCGTVRPRW